MSHCLSKILARVQNLIKQNMWQIQIHSVLKEVFLKGWMVLAQVSRLKINLITMLNSFLTLKKISVTVDIQY